jgi:hypothetical protein
MTRRHGRNGRLYMNLTSGGTAEPVAFLNNWEFNQATDTVEVTAFGDTNKVYVAGLPDASGSVSGFYDDATVQTYTAALDGVARKFYLYPDVSNNPGQYWWGTAFFDFSATGGSDSAIELSASFVAASAIAKVG